MSCSNYKFDWIGSYQWRLTSRTGMVWEGELLCDNVDTTHFDQLNLVVLESKITKGDNTPIPVNGQEKLRYYIKRSVVNGLRRLVDKLTYNV